MSRCLPYPPPGYTLSRSVEEALIESIKLHKEKLKVKQQKEEKKKEKQEKKRIHKEKRKGIQEKVKLSLDQCDSFNGGKSRKSIWPNAEQLEKSGLTEEHDPPICLRSASSESSGDSNKRKRPSQTDVNRGHGKIIRIKLPTKKPDIANPNQDVSNVSSNPCFPAGRVADVSLRIRQGSSSFIDESSRRADNEVTTLSTSGNNDLVRSERFGVVPRPEDSSMTATQNQEFRYRNLIENCVPLPFPDSWLDLDNLDWLVSCRNRVERTVNQQNYDAGASSRLSRSSIEPPRACYLAESDVYALPYTIPF